MEVYAGDAVALVGEPSAEDEILKVGAFVSEAGTSLLTHEVPPDLEVTVWPYCQLDADKVRLAQVVAAAGFVEPGENHRVFKLSQVPLHPVEIERFRTGELDQVEILGVVAEREGAAAPRAEPVGVATYLQFQPASADLQVGLAQKGAASSRSQQKLGLHKERGGTGQETFQCHTRLGIAAAAVIDSLVVLDKRRPFGSTLADDAGSLRAQIAAYESKGGLVGGIEHVAGVVARRAVQKQVAHLKRGSRVEVEELGVLPLPERDFAAQVAAETRNELFGKELRLAIQLRQVLLRFKDEPRRFRLGIGAQGYNIRYYQAEA